VTPFQSAPENRRPGDRISRRRPVGQAFPLDSEVLILSSSPESKPMQKERFKIETEQAVLDDLRERLHRTRFAPDFANDDWRYGTNLTYLKHLIEYWRDRYDWRRVEREINSFAHYKTAIEGIPIHFIHEPGKGPRPIPLILTHGWPWTFWDFQKVI